MLQKHNTNQINEQITAKKLLVIDNYGKNVGQLSIEDALARAEEVDLDLILINPGNENQLPIAKIYDYGKFTYEQKVKAKGNKQKSLDVKECQIRPVTNKGDME
jgi:translation initiation factor IF-3